MKIFKPIFAIFSVLAAVILVACSNPTNSSTGSSSSTSGAHVLLKKSKKVEQSRSVFSVTRNHLAMWMQMVNTKDMTSI